MILGDIASPPDHILKNENVTYVKVDVTVWKELCVMFKKAKEQHGQIDHVFCNAGVIGSTDFFKDGVDEDGDPLPLNTQTFDVNLMGVARMTKLAIWYMSKQESGGSIVLNASIACNYPSSLLSAFSAMFKSNLNLRHVYIRIDRL